MEMYEDEMMVHLTIKELEEERKNHEIIGWQDCLDSVVGSLRGYPNHGGDIDVMHEVERLIEEGKSGDWYDKENQ
jgi:hypothetical protein